MSNWTKDVAQQVYNHFVKFWKALTKTLSTFGKWSMPNHKNRIVIVGSVIGMVAIVFLLEFMLSSGFMNDRSSAGNDTKFSETIHLLKPDSTNIPFPEFVNNIDNQFIIYTYYGTIGDEQFKLSIDQVEGDEVMGHHVIGSKRSPVKGKIVSKRTEPTGSGGSYSIFNVKLKEPAADQSNGEFNIELWVWISDVDRHGYGNWQAYNGKLNRHVSLNDKKTESNPLPATRSTDSLWQVEGSIKPQVVANQVQVVTTDPVNFNQRVKVKLNSLIRDKPDQSSKAIKTASKGKIIHATEKTATTAVIEVNGVKSPHSWYKVSYNSSDGQTYVGWIYGGYLELN